MCGVGNKEALKMSSASSPFHLYEALEQTIHEGKSKTTGTSGWEREEWRGDCFRGPEFLFGVALSISILEIDSGNGQTTLLMCLMPLNCPVKNG